MAELYWKWGVRAGLALLLVLANALLVIAAVNAPDAFGALDNIGDAAESLKRTAETLDILVAELGEDAERITVAVEQAGDDAASAVAAVESASDDVTRAVDAVERAGEDIAHAVDVLADVRSDTESAAKDFERIADSLEKMFP